MRIKELCYLFTDGDWIETKDQSDEGIRLIQTGNIGEGVFLEKINKERYITEGTFKRLNCTEVFPEDILISRLPEPVGRGCIIPNKTERMITAVDCTICRLKNNLIDNQYFCYYINSPAYYKQLNQNVTGTTRKRISRKNLGNVEIKLPDKTRQLEIVSHLNIISSILNNKRKELQLLNDLTKARFVEMFGGKKRYMIMQDFCSIITDGTHQPPKFAPEGIPFIFVSNIVEDKVTYNTTKFIDQNTYDELIKRTPIEIGDILLSTVGSYGHPAVVKTEKKFLFQRHIAYLKPRKDIINSTYLHSAILSQDAQRQIEESVKGIAQKTLNLSEIKKMRIPVPCLQEQNDFSTFVTQIDKSKVMKRLRLSTNSFC